MPESPAMCGELIVAGCLLILRSRGRSSVMGSDVTFALMFMCAGGGGKKNCPCCVLAGLEVRTAKCVTGDSTCFPMQ